MLPTATDPPHASRQGAPVAAHRARGVLFTTALLDELTTGLLVVALPLLRDTLHLSYAQAGLIFTAGALSSVLIEPPITLAAARRRCACQSSPTCSPSPLALRWQVPQERASGERRAP